MDQNGEDYSFDLNLDFLDSTTTTPKDTATIAQYQEQTTIQSPFDIELLANRIATVNDMTIQLKAIKDENSRLQKQMQDLSESALSIRNMYEQEKAESLKFAKLSQELQAKCDQVESQLTNKSLHFEQIQSRLELESADKKPVSYNDLALKYQRLALQVEAENHLHSKEKVTLQLMREYLESNKLHPLPFLKKKHHPKTKTRNFSMQCEFKPEMISQEMQCSLGYCEEEPKDTCTQGTQYTWYTTTRGTNTPAQNIPQKELRTQGTQYISSTTTRATSTSALVITQSVGTNFPEPVPPISIDDILKEMIFDVSPLSPMSASPPTEMKEETPEMKSIGTNTDLRNVRKPIEYVAANIKHSDSRPASRNNLYDRVKNETPMMGIPPIVNPFVGMGMTAPPMHSTVTELWNMLGHTIFTLLQQNGGVVPLNQMQMNIAHDRMRNPSGVCSRDDTQHRSNEPPAARNEYFSEENPRGYPTSTRSAATSPFIPSELENCQPCIRPTFFPVNRSNTPTEIEKIVLKNRLPEPVVSSSKKISQVDEILQLFPEYSDSLKKRKAIKKLLNSSIKQKKLKERNEASSPANILVTSQPVPQTQTWSSTSDLAPPQLEANWKNDIFGDYSDSSLDSNITETTVSTPQKEPEEMWTPVKPDCSSNDMKLHIFNPILDIKRPSVDSPLEEEFLGFDEETKLPPSSDKVFCIPFSPARRHQPDIAANSSLLQIPNKINIDSKSPQSSIEVKVEPTKNFSSTKSPNRKRKRRAKKALAQQSNKVSKLDENCLLAEPEMSTVGMNIPKGSSSLNETKAIVETTPNVSVKRPKRSLSLSRIKNLKQEPNPEMFTPPPPNRRAPKKPIGIVKQEWANIKENPEEDDVPMQLPQKLHRPMVMKVENPPDSIIQDLKTCLTNQKHVGDVKSSICPILPKHVRDVKPFIGPILPTETPKHENYVPPEKTSQIFVSKKDEAFQFLLQNESVVINQSPGSNFKTINSYQTPDSEDLESHSKSSITILNGEFISESNVLRATKPETLLSIETSDANTLEHKILDLNNAPIYFVSDEGVLNNPEINKQELALESVQGAAYSCQNSILLPGFQEIQQGLRSGTTPNAFSWNNRFQEQELKNPNLDLVHSSRLPIIVQDNTQNFLPKSAETTTRAKADLNHHPPAEVSLNCDRKDQNLCKKFDTRETKMDALDPKSETIILPHQSCLSASLPKLHSQNPFGLKIIRDTTSKNPFKCNPQEENQDLPSEFHGLEHVNTLSNPLNINKSITTKETHFSPIQSSTKPENPPKSPISIGTITKHETTSSSSSDSECDLSIDLPPSPEANNTSSLDLSVILKTPDKKYNPESEFKTPDTSAKNTSTIDNALSSSTEKLVEDYLRNEIPGSEGPKFQIFLDRILNEVAPPSSPISVLAPSEKRNYSGTESSCDDETSSSSVKRKYKRKAAATAAIAVKRSARIKANKVETNEMTNTLSTFTIPPVQLGKYTKKNPDEKLKEKEPIVVPENKHFEMRFSQVAMDEDDEEPICEPIRRYPVEKNKILEDEWQTNRKMKDSFNERQNPISSPAEVDSYLSLCRKAKESLMLQRKSDESYSPQSPVPDSHTNSCGNLDESPASPPPFDRQPTETHTVLESFETTPFSVKNSTHNNTLLSHLIANYNPKHHQALISVQKSNNKLLSQLDEFFNEFLSGLCLLMDTVRLVDSIRKLTKDGKIISKAIVSVLKIAPRPQTEATGPIPDTFLSQTHLKLLSVLEHLQLHIPTLRQDLQYIIEQTLFSFNKEIMPVEVLMNLTQFYLAIIANPAGGTNPARLFICKCLYFYNQKAIPMIYQTLCVYPTVLPQRIDTTYDRSDVLISTIQSILMSTYYDPEKIDLMTKQILAKLRMFYNYESFKPPRDEVIENMIAKIRAGRFKNVPYAFSLICKRMEQSQTEKFILNERLMPLANEFYNNLTQGNENDEKIACVLECISFVIKPFSLSTDISQYVNLFSRFLNAATESKFIQEAAVAAILRTVRFGYVQCFNAVYNFKPTYELSETLKAMLGTFIYKKRKDFLMALVRQAHELVA